MESRRSSLQQLSDEELIRQLRQETDARADECREILFQRLYPKVGSWCLRWTGEREEARDLAQEVILRIHERLHTFQGRSRFTTWSYSVMRSVALNRAKAATRRPQLAEDEESLPEFPAPEVGIEEQAQVNQLLRRLRRAMASDLEPTEAQVLYLHHVQGMTLPAITDLLGLENKSGAKAFVVSGKRKLHRRFRHWLGGDNTGLDRLMGEST